MANHKAEIEKLERWIRRATAALENPELLTEYDDPDEIREGMNTRLAEIERLRSRI